MFTWSPTVNDATGRRDETRHQYTASVNSTAQRREGVMSLLVGLDRDCGAAALGVTVVYNFRTCHVRYGLVPFECAFRRHQRQNMDRRGFLNKSRFALMTAAFLELVPDLKTSNGQV